MRRDYSRRIFLCGMRRRSSKARAALVKGFLAVSGFILATQSFGTEMTMVCHIHAIEQHGMLRLEAVATAQEPVRGQYRFEVLKQSSSGTSQNVQSGAFDLQPNRDNLLTTVTLDGSAFGHYQAKLTLGTDTGSVTCGSP
jgi:hypothetical protein